MYRQHEGNQIGGTSYSGYLRKRISKMKEQRQVLFDTYRQGKAFLRVFDSQMTKEQRDGYFEELAATATKFATMADASFFGRRYLALRYGFLKSGLIRNAGLFFLL